MTIFKNYLKVAKSFLPIILIYTGIFIGFAMIASSSGASTQTFEAEEAKIALINNDIGSEFVKNFEGYIKDNAEYVDLKNTDEELRDALFFRKVDYIMIVPQGFTEDFLSHKNVKIKTMEVPDSYGSIYSKTLMNKYLNTAKLYLQAGITDREMVEMVKKDLAIHTDMTMQTITTDAQINSVVSFYNFSNYTLLSIIIVVVSMVMIAFNEEKMRRRNLVSCIPYRSFNRQLLFGNIFVSFGVWLVYVIASFILYGKTMISSQGLLIIANSFIFVIFILVFSFFLVTLTHNRELVSGISTVVGLGTSFIAGAFVPQEMLAPFVLNLAKWTPSYWFISNNNMIAKVTNVSINNLQPIFINMSIILGFAILFYILIQVVSRLKLKR